MGFYVTGHQGNVEVCHAMGFISSFSIASFPVKDKLFTLFVFLLFLPLPYPLIAPFQPPSKYSPSITHLCLIIIFFFVYILYMDAHLVL